MLDGSNGKVMMNLPARTRRWEVHGESLSVEGRGADVVVDWIADDGTEADNRRINRLMGVSIRSLWLYAISHFYKTIKKKKY